MDRDDDGNGSQRSGATASETSSQREDAKFLLKKRGTADAQDEGDLLEQKRTIEDGIFSCMYTLVRTSALSTWKFAVLKVSLEFLMFFIVCFNPEISLWAIDTSSPVWQVVRWCLWRSPITRLYSYKTYIIVLYVMVVMVYLAVAGLVFLTHSMRRAEQSSWLRKAALYLHGAYDMMFFTCYASFFDYFTFAANCNYTDKAMHHHYFSNVRCFEMPHLLHFCVAVVTASLFLALTAGLIVASGDLNPVSRAALASPAVYPRLKILAAKAVFVVCAGVLDSAPKVQAVLNVCCVVLINWWNLRTLPFYRNTVNAIWFGLWLGIMYTTCLYCMLVFSNRQDDYEHLRRYTRYVLYGMFPVIAGGTVICATYVFVASRPARLFRGVERDARLRKLYKFTSTAEVEFLSRCMRVMDAEGLVEEEAAYWGETILKAGMLAFPSNPYLLVLYANFLLEVRKDGPAARTQLQLAAKHMPSIVDRYQVFCTLEASKRLKDSQECGMDLQAYIEFKRNYRAVLRVHKEALTLQIELWRLYLKPQLRVAEVDAAMDALDQATARANQVYKRVLERYPTNGKLLRCYGKFLEDVRHDPAAAVRAYAEANRNGGAGALLSLDLTSLQSGAEDRPEVFSSISLEDAIVVVNAEGTVMMVSQSVQSLFGYASLELEGANVSLLMPPPFTQRHAGYMSRYIATGEAHILDTVREVVGLHKDRYVFPLSIAITKLSGTGSDSVFLGLLRRIPPSHYSMRMWLSPTGIFLCGEQAFASMIGLSEGALVGKSLLALVDPACREALEALLERCRTAPFSELLGGTVRAELKLLHRYLDPVPVEVTVGMAGTDAQRILVLNCRRTDGRDGNILVVDSHMRLKFASVGVASMLGYSARKLTFMRLDQLMPPPFNALHAKWLRDPPHIAATISCRSGLVVPLLNDCGARVPVRITVLAGNAMDAASFSSVHHIIRVEKVAADEEVEERRLVLTVDFFGRVRAVSRPYSTVLGFPAWALMEASLCDFVDVFDEWRQSSGSGEMQLLLLALLNKEQETPGASWRVRVREPARKGEAAPAWRSSGTRRRGGGVAAEPVWRSACLQVELVDEREGVGEVAGNFGDDKLPAGDDDHDADDDGDGSQARVRLVLWRRDLLSGVLELDADLTIRRASAAAGLILGVAATTLLRKSLGRFLDTPPGATWASLTAGQRHRQHKKSSLKSTAEIGIVSAPLALTGTHPDSGTMRVVLQGVQTLGPGGRPKVSVVFHADTSHVGARANLMKVLHLHHHVHNGGRGDNGGGFGHAATATAMDAGDGCAAAAATTIRPLGAATSLRARAVQDVGDLATVAVAVSGPLLPILEEAEGGGGGNGGGGSDGGDGGGGGGEEEGVDEQGEGTLPSSDSGSGSGGRHRGHSAAVSSDESLPQGRRRDSKCDDDSDGVDSIGGAVDDPADQDAAAHEVARLHRQATSRSEFVAQWVRTVMSQRIRSMRRVLGFGGGPAAVDGLEKSLSLARRQSSGLGGFVGTAAAATAAAAKPPLLRQQPQLFSSRFGSMMIRRGGNSLNPTSGSFSALEPANGGGGGGGIDLGGDGRQVSRRRSAASLNSESIRTRSEEGSNDENDGNGGGDGGGVGGSGGVGGVGGGAAGDDGGLELMGVAGGGDDGGDGDGAGQLGGGSKWEKASDGDDSSVGESEATSGLTSVTDQSSTSDLAIDTRRQRLHKALNKVLLGPSLAQPINRLQYMSYAVMAIMLLAQVVCYVVVTKLVHNEHNHMYQVHQAALAVDRSQLIMWRVMMGPYCERANITDKSSACGNTMSYTLGKLMGNLQDMERYHQGVYLGLQGIDKLTPPVYELWTTPSLQYSIFLDTKPPQVVEASTGIWQLGNRFLAASRETLYWLPKLKDKYMWHRTWKFVVAAGMGPLFTGGTRSLDLLMASAWKSLEELRTSLIVVLVIEALCVQLLCSAYQWQLVARVEGARVVGLVAMLGLPGPVLRQLASQEVKVWDDDDDDDDDDSDDGIEDLEGHGEHHHRHHQNNDNNIKDIDDDNNSQQQQEAGRTTAEESGGRGRGRRSSSAGGGSSDASADAADIKAAKMAAAARQQQQRRRPPVRLSLDQVEIPTATTDADAATASFGPLALPRPRASLDRSSGSEGEEAGRPGRRTVAASRFAPAGSRTAKFMRGAVGPNGQGGAGVATAAIAAAAGASEPPWNPPGSGPAGEQQRGRRWSATGSGGDGGSHGDGGGGGGGGGGHLARARALFVGRGTRINGKLLLPSRANILKLMAPFLLLNVAVILVYTVSVSLLSGMQDPLALLNMAAHVIYRYTHMRCCAWGLVAADDNDSRAKWRQLLVEQVRLFEDEYNVLMYGGTSISQVNSVFQKSVPPGAFSSGDFSDEFFRKKRCFRWDQSLCLPPGHKYYEVTHNGLDVMVRRVIQEMHLLSLDNDADARYNRSRYDFIHLVGGRDCYEGLQSAAQLFVDYSISRYKDVTRFHSVLLGVSSCIFVLYTLLLLWPRVSRIRSDAARQSALLSHVPPEVDVRAHVRRALRIWGSGRAGGGGGGLLIGRKGGRGRFTFTSALAAPGSVNDGSVNGGGGYGGDRGGGGP